MRVKAWDPPCATVLTNSAQLPDEVEVAVSNPGAKPATFFDRMRSLVAYAVNAAVEQFGTSPVWDNVVAIELKGGRTTYLHPYLERLVQQLWVQVANRYADPLLSPGAFAYRKGHSSTSALYVAKTAAKHGWPFVFMTDVRKFFDTTTVRLVYEVLLARCFPFSDDFARLGASFGSSHIDRRMGETYSWTPSRETLLQGSISAPLISNLAAHVILDAPFAVSALDLGINAYLLRYADDLLVIAKTEDDCKRARALLEQLVEESDWSLHPDKTSDIVDLRTGKIEWLGMELSEGRVEMCDQKLLEAVTKIFEEARSPIATTESTTEREAKDRLRSLVASFLVRHDLCSQTAYMNACSLLREGPAVLADHLSVISQTHAKRRLRRLRTYDRSYNHLRSGTFAGERTTQLACHESLGKEVI